MEKPTHKLIKISSDSIGPTLFPAQIAALQKTWGQVGSELAELLSISNGFWAYESALLVRPLRNAVAPVGIEEWNESARWKGSYNNGLSDILCFAEDVFGVQYCLRNGVVCTFDPETGAFEDVAPTLFGWAEAVLGDSDFRTGYPLAHEWQMRHGPLQPGKRLLPKVPFVLGGKFEIDNLYECGDVEGMLFRASIANQIRDLPDGAQIVLDVIHQHKAHRQR
jgi:hypothetical protein